VTMTSFPDTLPSLTQERFAGGEKEGPGSVTRLAIHSWLCLALARSPTMSVSSAVRKISLRALVK
jgi:hypothetical protein